ncbi:Ldh family oxidoreductase [Chloroflexota bacterium]
MNEANIRINVDNLRDFTTKVFSSLGVPSEDACIASDILIVADQRGVSSHGLRMLKWYTDRLRKGAISPVTKIKVLKESDSTLLISGENGLGQVVAYQSMKLTIDKALKNNVCLTSVRNSNHYGMAGYYSMMALEHDLIGIALTNASVLVVPTHGKTAVFGTNPISLAVPAGKQRSYVLDMATSTVSKGKLAVQGLSGKSIPLTWATDEFGNPTQDIPRVLANLDGKMGGGLLPLGGAGEESGGHKGYGLALAVDILSAVLSGGTFGPKIYPTKGPPAGACHFFGAINIEAFIGLNSFKCLMDEYIDILKNSEKATGCDRIFIHGEKEFELYEQQQVEVNIHRMVVEELIQVGEEVGVKASF